jgi:hypothetical protein
MDIVAPIIKAYLGLYDTYVEESHPIFFLDFSVEFKEHHKKWLFEVGEIYKEHPHYANLEVVCKQLVLTDNHVQNLQDVCEAIQSWNFGDMLKRSIKETYMDGLI